MDITEQISLIFSRAVERGLRIGQLFENLRAIFRYIGQDLFYVSDEDLLMTATRFVNGDDIDVWQAEETSKQIASLKEEIERLKAIQDARVIERGSAQELADFVNSQFGNDSTGDKANQYKCIVC